MIVWFWVALGSLILVMLAVSALGDLYWRRQGFRIEIRGSGRDRQKVRVRIDRQDPEP